MRPREAGRQNAGEYNFAKVSPMCFSLQMVKVFGRVLRTDALVRAEQWDTELWFQGEG